MGTVTFIPKLNPLAHITEKHPEKATDCSAYFIHDILLNLEITKLAPEVRRALPSRHLSGLSLMEVV